MSAFSQMLAPLWAAIARVEAQRMNVFSGTVTSVGPVRIQIDGQSAPLNASPDTLVPVAPGDRVRVLRYGTTHLILGMLAPGPYTRVKRSRTTAQNIPNSTWATMGSWNENIEHLGRYPGHFDGGGIYYTVNYNGWVKVAFYLQFASNTDGTRMARIRRNGSTLRVFRVPPLPYSTDIRGEWEGPTRPGDEFTIDAWQDSGGTLAMAEAEFFIERTA